MLSVDRVAAHLGATVPPPASHDLLGLDTYWLTARRLLGDDLALRVAADLPVGALGLPGYGVVSAPTLAHALDVLSSNIDRMIPGLGVRVPPAVDEHVEVRVHGSDDPLMPYLEEGLLAVIHRHLSLLTEPTAVTAVTLRRAAPPSSVAPWRTFFGVVPRFEQRHSALRLEARSLDVPMRTANPELHRIVRAASHSPPDASVAGRVRAYVRANLRGALDAATVAKALAMSSRTLQRKLQGEHMPLRDIVTAVRIEAARELLEHTDHAVAEISKGVGFLQPASFSRAFASLTGMSPGEFRKRHRYGQ